MCIPQTSWKENVNQQQWIYPSIGIRLACWRQQQTKHAEVTCISPPEGGGQKDIFLPISKLPWQKRNDAFFESSSVCVSPPFSLISLIRHTKVQSTKIADDRKVMLHPWCSTKNRGISSWKWRCLENTVLIRIVVVVVVAVVVHTVAVVIVVVADAVVAAVVAAVVVAAYDKSNLTCVFVAQGSVPKEDLSPWGSGQKWNHAIQTHEQRQ